MSLQLKSAGPGKILVKEAADILDAAGEIFEFYYDRETGAIVEVPTEEGLYDFEEADVPAAERELWNLVENDEDGKRFIKLPTQFEIHEWNIMREFVESLSDESHVRVLSEQIRGGGAFGRFKNAIARLGIEQKWYDYKTQALCELVRDWCEEHSIEPVEE